MLRLWGNSLYTSTCAHIYAHVYTCAHACVYMHMGAHTSIYTRVWNMCMCAHTQHCSVFLLLLRRLTGGVDLLSSHCFIAPPLNYIPNRLVCLSASLCSTHSTHTVPCIVLSLIELPFFLIMKWTYTHNEMLGKHFLKIPTRLPASALALLQFASPFARGPAVAHLTASDLGFPLSSFSCRLSCMFFPCALMSLEFPGPPQGFCTACSLCMEVLPDIPFSQTLIPLLCGTFPDYLKFLPSPGQCGSVGWSIVL